MAKGTKRKRKKKNSRLRWQRRIVLLLVIVIFVLAGAIAVSGARTKQPQVDVPDDGRDNSTQEPESNRKDGFYTVLVCGTDDGNGDQGQ